MSPVVPFPRPAASVIVLRPLRVGFEVLLVRRRGGGTFEGLVVFPGGAVDDIDRAYRAGRHGDSADRAAALRELAEETGLLAVRSGMIRAPGLREAHLYRWLSGRDLSLDVDSLVLVSRWVTPEMMPYRFDTRFYLLGAEHPPEVDLDHDELVEHSWCTPDSALARVGLGEWQMILPTLAHLRWLARRSTIAEALASAYGADGRTLISPRVLEDGSLVPIHLPAETA